MFVSFPTHFQFLPDAMLDQGEVKSTVFSALNGLSGLGLDRACDHLEQYRCDPWQRTAVARDEMLANMGSVNSGASRGEFAAALSKLIEQQEAEEAEYGPPSLSQLERWWRLVTDPVHVESEVSQMQNAWEGAIRRLEKLR